MARSCEFAAPRPEGSVEPKIFSKISKNLASAPGEKPSNKNKNTKKKAVFLLIV